MSFDPDTVDWTDPENYFRCRTCGNHETAHIAVGSHDWLACDDCLRRIQDLGPDILDALGW